MSGGSINYLIAGNDCMLKKILLISSEFTGRGHKSITDALCEQFSRMDGIDVSILEGFSLMGKTGIRVSKFYGPLTRTSKEAWALTWKVAQHQTDTVNKTVRAMIGRRFMEVLEREQPDVIVSVHPMFIGCILDVLEKHQIKIPFVSLYADLVSISNLWVDSRADYSICYTQEAIDYSLEEGVPAGRLKRFSFPVRERFTYGAPVAGSQLYKSSGLPTFLIMSGGEGSGDMVDLARMLLHYFNCRVKVLTGRNAALRERLEKTERETYRRAH